MEVVIWQLFVIGSVVVAFAGYGRKAAFWVCTAWTAWTVLAVFMLPLVLIQLLFCWGTYVVCNWFASLTSNLRGREGEIDELKQRVEAIVASTGVSDRQAQMLKEALHDARSSLDVVEGADHLSVLKRAFAEARGNVCILSGWIGTPLLDVEVQQLIQGAISRGVRIFLGFGWESSSGHVMTATAQAALRFLRGLDKSRVAVAQFANHEKILVVDELYCVIGSNNWLSNATFRNSERSVLLRLPQFAAEEAARIKLLVMKHLHEASET